MRSRVHAEGVLPGDRVLLLIGGTVVLAAVWIVSVYLLAANAGSGLQEEILAAHRVQALGDQLLIEVQGQHEELGEYLMSGDSGALRQYWQAVAAEYRITGEIQGTAGRLAGITDALARVTDENAEWRSSIARPAIIAAESGSRAGLQSAASGTTLFATPGFEHNGVATVACQLVHPVSGTLQAIVGMLAPDHQGP